MRKQYYFRPSERGLLAWDVDRLVELSRALTPRHVSLADIRELDQAWFGESEDATWRSLVGHVALMDQADLAYPIILAADGAVMDGMHRVAKALRLGHTTIAAVQFATDPAPDHVGRGPADLPY